MTNYKKTSHLIACPDCDLLLRAGTPQQGHSLICPRCGSLLQRKRSNTLLKVQALSLTGLLLYFPSLLMPLLKLDAFGFSDSANLLESIVHLFQVKYYFVASMVSLFAAVIPLTVLLLIFTVSLTLSLGKHCLWTAKLYRFYLHLNEWAMLEVYLLGILVSIIKMAPIASISYLPGFFCFICLVLVIVCITATMDKVYFWQTIEELSPQLIPPTPPVVEKTTAMESGLLLCHTCWKLLPAAMEGKSCPRCGDHLHHRKPQARSRTWALVITAALLLFPANILPIMEVDFLGDERRKTIIDGILYFFETRSYFVGTVIFCASVLVPVFKVIGLSILLLGKKRTPEHQLQTRTKLYRFITFIGRWSMLDIFVIALLAAMVDFGFVTTTWAAPGATWFCMVVAVTMFAALSFDPRTMWDRANIQE